jgi:DNA-binding MarR family transcriptional regulator
MTARRDEPEFGLILGLAFDQFTSELHSYLDAKGFTDVKPTFAYPIKALAAESLTTSELAAKLGITPQGAAKVVEEMVRAGYVTRESNADDKRAKPLGLTARSRSLLAAGKAFNREFERQLRRQVGGAQLTAARDALDKILARGGEPPAVLKRRTGLARHLS